MFKVKWIIAAALLGAATVQLTLMAAGAAPGAPAGNGAPSRDAASITLAPSPRVIACDSADASTVTVRIEDAQGRAVPDGTIVHFDAVYGYADPVEAATRRGEAATDVRFYPYAQNYPGRTELRVFASGLRAAVGIDCAPPEPGCHPSSPPQHPMSPPCEPPPGCNQPFSPPLHPMSPPCGISSCVSFDSPPACPTPPPSCIPVDSPPSCVTPTPTVPPCDPFTSPPCTPTQDLCLDPASPTATPVNVGDPLYELYANGSENAGTVLIDLGISDLGGGNYQAVQWGLCYDWTRLKVTSIARAASAPSTCTLKTDNGVRVLAGCIDIFGDNLTHFGDTWLIEMVCVATGDARFRVIPRSESLSANSFVYRQREYAPITTNGSQVVHCTSAASPTATPTPPTTPLPLFTSTPTATLTSEGGPPATSTPTSWGLEPFTVQPIYITDTPTPTPTPKPGNRR